tara:strand:+ start:16851 stop:17678 length:828 start_codon:yes stop_codon:yes gene_type:complete
VKAFQIPGVLWLLDYHPEIEARGFEEKGVVGRWVASLLRKWDSWSQNAFERVIVPDEAMAKVAHRLSSHPNIEVFPTWNQSLSSGEGLRSLAGPVGEMDAPTILYCGNVGGEEDLWEFEQWLACRAEDGKRLKLLSVGTGEKGRLLFSDLSARMQNLSWEHLGRLSDEELIERVRTREVGLGLVLMREERKGLLSPSKYATYLHLGLPILYFGPEGTNADRVCREFGGGISLGSSSRNAGLGSLQSLDRIQLVEGVQRASQEFQKYTALKFTELL